MDKTILEEFDKKFPNLFIRVQIEHGTGMMSTYGWKNKKEDVKTFLDKALKKKDIEYSVSEWKRIGKQRGYWSFFEKEVKDRIVKEIEGKLNKLINDWNEPEFTHERHDTLIDYTKNLIKGIQDIIN